MADDGVTVVLEFKDGTTQTFSDVDPRGWGVNDPPGWVCVLSGGLAHYYSSDSLARVTAPIRKPEPHPDH